MTLEELKAHVDTLIAEDYSRKRHLIAVIRLIRKRNLEGAIAKLDELQATVLSA